MLRFITYMKASPEIVVLYVPLRMYSVRLLRGTEVSAHKGIFGNLGRWAAWKHKHIAPPSLTYQLKRAYIITSR